MRKQRLNMLKMRNLFGTCFTVAGNAKDKLNHDIRQTMLQNTQDQTSVQNTQQQTSLKPSKNVARAVLHQLLHSRRVHHLDDLGAAV